ncbi:LON peptidase N-terminal domain and RING finger protein 1 [Lepeophtheirus salmonis]|uniref:LON peptidase N-terminal domain and RING finger protein 1 n=1 Tax=Lepeophtheirus salmonis TaxID=72036 RepID=A0A7R8D4M4_LEPSM|nr:LON peptidase N-terminal domain and RING finger protein 1 [Lepeophtheirus salmonis]CAF2973666.1 LON peptidase N-terminal domain and RING finger protein 1 [Lepeophtheirus salmonis]
MSVCRCCKSGRSRSGTDGPDIEYHDKLLSELEKVLEEGSWEEGFSIALYLLRSTCRESLVERRKAEKGILLCLRMRAIDPGTTLADAWTCSECWSVLQEPITLKCGHSVPSSPNLNVLVNDMAHKYWDSELKAVELKNEGNKKFKRGNLHEALEAYSEACKLNPNDASLHNNRSNAYFKINEYEAALKDAETAIKLRPNWTKAYYRKSVALRRLNRDEDAFKTLYQCLILDKDPSVLIQNEICSLLTQMNLTFREEDLDEKKTLKILEIYPALKAKQKESREVIHLIKDATNSIEKFLRTMTSPKRLPVDSKQIDASDYECPLCFRLFWEPVTTPCGHTFCRSCLDQMLPHVNLLFRAFVGYCRMPMTSGKRLHDEETRDLIGKETPIFVCTMSFPSVPCPLHVYEPRYRLMIRRCMETGTREFGMCPPGTGSELFADYGTMLEVKSIKYFPDGRSVVGAVGGRRFHVLSRRSRDGYNVANIEFLVDDTVADEEEVQEIQELHDVTHKLTCDWFKSMKSQLQEEIESHFGPMPEKEQNYWKMSSGPSWMCIATKRGRHSTDTELMLDEKKQRGPNSHVPIKEVRQAGVEHFMNWKEKRQTCNMPG